MNDPVETTPPISGAPGRAPATAFEPYHITRPDPALLTFYVVVAAFTLIGFPFVFLPLYFKYKTLRYAFDDKGVAMSWGILFRREIHLTYRRIQDIHLTRTFVHRWFGLADVAVQTASGSAGAEMTIVGVREAEALRDFLYSKMRGAQEGNDVEGETDHADEALTLLHAIRDELRRLGDDHPGESRQ